MYLYISVKSPNSFHLVCCKCLREAKKMTEKSHWEKRQSVIYNPYSGMRMIRRSCPCELRNVSKYKNHVWVLLWVIPQSTSYRISLVVWRFEKSTFLKLELWLTRCPINYFTTHRKGFRRSYVQYLVTQNMGTHIYERTLTVRNWNHDP